jgi:hypothetical protein
MQHTETSQPSRQLLELQHTDVMGPLPESFVGGKFVVSVLDDWSAACVARPVCEKVQKAGLCRRSNSAGKTVQCAWLK